MMGGVLFGFGLVTSLLAGTVAVAAAAVSRVELSRWVSNRLRGAVVASRVYEAPGQMLRVANALGAFGILTAGLGAAGLVAQLPAGPALAAILFLGLPLAAMAGYGVPAAVGRRWSDPVVNRATPLTERVSRVVRPLVAGAGNGTPVLTGAVAEGHGDADSEEQVKMVEGVLTFTDRQVRDVMTPRTAVIALDETASLSDFATAFTDSGYSRIPVYSGTLDNVVGMVHAFDLLKVTPGSSLPIRPVVETPGPKSCPELLVEFQRERRQMAVVLDEFGGTAGIVTLEDLLEELVGEIFDDVETVEPRDDTPVAEFEGAAPIEELRSRFDIELLNGAETVGGFIAQLAGRIPQAGEHLRWEQLEFDVIEATPVRIDRVVVRRGPLRSTVIRPGTR